MASSGWGNRRETLGILLVIAIFHTLLLTLFHRPLNRWVNRNPQLLAIDLVFVGGILGATGGASSPFYLYALSPLLAGAFFFQVRGALIGSLFFTPLYLVSLIASGPAANLDTTLLFTQFAGIWLLPLAIAYPSILISQLERAQEEIKNTGADLARQNAELARSNRQLEIIHDLTTLLQAAPDVLSVQKRVITAVSGELGFSSAAVGLVSPGEAFVKNWRKIPENSATAPPELPLETGSGPLIDNLLCLRPGRYFRDDRVSNLKQFNAWLGQGPWMSFPLNLREHLVGVLLVQPSADIDRLSQDRIDVLEVVASQAAVSLGTTMLCIDRAQQLAVEEERNRIARDIHDTVAQSLFGIVFSLDACISMLPGEAQKVHKELVELRDLASRVREEVRSSIFDLWPSELDLTRFEDDLQRYVSQCCRPQTFQIDFSIEGPFDSLSPAIRRNLYRIAQEALTNSARHSGADSAQVLLHIDPEQIILQVNDQGRGFDPAEVLAHQLDQEQFGLHGIQERTQAMAGSIEINSSAENGTQLLIQLPNQPQSRIFNE